MSSTDHILDSIYESLTFIDDEECHYNSIASDSSVNQFETAPTSLNEIVTCDTSYYSDPQHHWCVDQTELIGALVERFKFPVHKYKPGALYPYIEPQIAGFPLHIRNVEQESLWCYSNYTAQVNYILNGRHCTAMSQAFFFEIVEKFLECVYEFD